MKMVKGLLFWTFLSILGIEASALAQGPGATFTALGSNPTSGQVTCAATPTLLYTTTASGGAAPWGRLSITFQNQSGQPVYIAPRPDISASNAGILLGTQYSSATFDRSSGNVSWYCITASSTATIGWTEEK